jgi:hypothetical protein
MPRQFLFDLQIPLQSTQQVSGLKETTKCILQLFAKGMTLALIFDE